MRTIIIFALIICTVIFAKTAVARFFVSDDDQLRVRFVDIDEDAPERSQFKEQKGERFEKFDEDAPERMPLKEPKGERFTNVDEDAVR